MGASTKILQILQVLKNGCRNSHLGYKSDTLLTSEFITKVCLLVDAVTKNDLNFDHRMMSDDAPVTYFKVFDDSKIVTASVFALKKDACLPIHDHPSMYGFIRCIYGTLKVSSFTKIDMEFSFNEKFEAKKLGQITALREPTKTLDERIAETVVLTPNKRNIHTITPINGPAAFIDFLTPPYTYPDRQCHYYEEVGDKGSVVTLKEVECPTWYWCEDKAYLDVYNSLND